jgi:hypothetical protein
LLFSVLRYLIWVKPSAGSAMYGLVVIAGGDTPPNSSHRCTELSKDRRCKNNYAKSDCICQVIFLLKVSKARILFVAPPVLATGASFQQWRMNPAGTSCRTGCLR